ncbi:MAG TPA: hypothetical protein VNW97_11885 [Candidatus Saccharimonadales bacterium]|jgi:hypothetical protein|nr:hypothetical protein [Candidatus Saccharimonadales bacterium]
MDRRLKLLVLCLFLLVIAIIGLGTYYRISSAPEDVLLLPEGNLLLYGDLQPIHLLDHDNAKAGRPDPDRLNPEYRAFVEQTGIQFERDLGSIAISQRFPQAEVNTESSAIFTGTFDSTRLRNYLQKISATSESYADKTVFSIPHEGNIVRAAILDARTVAITNMESGEPLRGIIDKFRNPSLAGHGPYLLQTYHRHVPAASLAWLIYRAPPHSGPVNLLGGASVGFLENTVSVASVRYSGALAVKAEVFTLDESSAKNLAESAGTFLALYRTAGGSTRHTGADQDVKAAIDSIEIQQKGNSAVFTATVSQGFLRKVVPEVQSATGAGHQP